MDTRTDPKRRSVRERWYRAPTAIGLSESSIVDRASNEILGFRVIEAGEARGHGEEIDGETLDAVVELGNAPAKGVKMRFGHPGMSDDALPDFAGRAMNFRREGDTVFADARLDPSAFLDPNRMAERVMARAESDPESFGTSLVMRRDLKFRLNEDGTRAEDDEGQILPPLIRPIAVLASDFVDSPAATSSLFSGVDRLSAEATAALDEFMQRPDAAERVLDFFDRYLHARDREDAMTTRIEPASDPVQEDRGGAQQEEAQSLMARLSSLLGLGRNEGAQQTAVVAPTPPPANVADEHPASEPDAKYDELRTQVSELRAELERQRATSRDDALQAQVAAFEGRVAAAQRRGTGLTATAAEAIKNRGRVLLSVGESPDVLIEAFEAGPAIEDVAQLSEEVTFASPEGDVTVPVDMMAYGAVQGSGGQPAFDRAGAVETAALLHGAESPKEVMARLARAKAADGRY